MIARAAFAALVALCAGAASAQEIERDEEAVGAVEAGVFCTEETGERRESPGSVAGFSNIVSEIALRAPSAVVPVSPDLTFGFRAVVLRDAPDAVLRITHPPFRGLGATRQWFVRPVEADDVVHALYAFDGTHEMVEGLWRFELHDGERVLVGVTLQAVPAAAAPHLVGLCEGLPQLSRAGALTPPAPAGRG